MDKLKDLLTSRLGRLGERRPSAQKDQPKETAEDLLQSLPQTKQFLENSAWKVVIEQARNNDEKALEARRKLKEVDNLVSLHENTALELRRHVSDLTALKADISRAVEHAYSVQQQLFELQREVSEAENIINSSQLQKVRAAEEQKFNEHAGAKRAELAKKKAEYDKQLQQFERERFSISASEQEEVPRRKKSPVASPPPDNNIRRLDLADLDIHLGNEYLGEAGEETKTNKNNNKNNRESELDDFLGGPSDGGGEGAGSTAIKSISKGAKSRPERPQILMDEDFEEE